MNSELINYLKENLSIGFDVDERDAPKLNLYLEDEIISDTKIPLDIIFKRVSEILYYYD